MVKIELIVSKDGNKETICLTTGEAELYLTELLNEKGPEFCAQWMRQAKGIE